MGIEDEKELPVGLCAGCLKQGVIKDHPEWVFGICMACGNGADCVRGDSILVFFPYIPLLKPVAPDPGRKPGEQ